MKITEQTVSWNIDIFPTIPLHEKIICMIDPRHDNVERILSVHLVPPPPWIKNVSDDYVKFIYCPDIIPKIECTYYINKKLFVCTKIKYIETVNYETLFKQLFEILGLEYLPVHEIKYKGMDILYVKKWCLEIFADVITNCSAISNNIALCEQICTIHKKKVYTMITDTNVKITLTPSNIGIYVLVSKLSSKSMLPIIIHMLNDKIFPIYENEYEQRKGYYMKCMNEIVLKNPVKKTFNYTYTVPTWTECNITEIEQQTHVTITVEVNDTKYCVTIINVRNQKHLQYILHFLPYENVTDNYTYIDTIESLRQEVPSLFIKNYTRECSNVPRLILYTEQNIKNSLLYHDRLYVAPPGYVVGLKVNRLPNKDKFPYLVTYYEYNHLENKRSNTYKFLVGELSNKYNNKFFNSLKNLLNFALPECKLLLNPDIPSYIIKQETPGLNENELFLLIKNGNPASKIYRYYEELLHISIHVIVVNSTDLQYVPKKQYIWEPVYDRHVVIYEHIKQIYDNTHIYYELFKDDNDNCIFSGDNKKIQSIIAHKKSLSLRPPDTRRAVKQYIDEHGMCRIIQLHDGSEEFVYTRPQVLPLIDNIDCFYHTHLNKLNLVKEEMKILPIDPIRTSTSTLIFYSNEESYKNA